MKFKFTLKTQLFILFIGLLLIVVGIVVAYLSSKMMDIILEGTEKDRLNKFDLIENEIESFCKDMEKNLYAIFLDSNISEFTLEGYSVEPEGILLRREIGNSLDMVIERNPDTINSIFIRTSRGDEIGTEGNFNYNLHGQTPPSNVSFDDKNEFKWDFCEIMSYSTPNSKIKKQVISLSRRFNFADQGSFVDIIINIEPSAFAQLYNYQSVNNSNIYICDSSKMVISNPIESKIKTTPAFAKSIDTSVDSHSFVHSYSTNNKSQVIYRVMENQLNWIIVEEVPLKQYSNEINQIIPNVIFILCISFAVAIVLASIIIKGMTKPLNVLMLAMKKMKAGEVGYHIDEKYYNEFGEIIVHFNTMSDSVERLMEDNKQAERMKTNYAIAMLKSQINPHFIFNTLNMIKWMAISQKANNIKSSIEMLMTMLKPIFKDKNRTCIISEEIEYVKNYVKLVNLRFGDNIKLICELPEEILQSKIPKFILQPIVENCIEHGFSEKEVNAVITIDAQIVNNQIWISVRDNGIGMTQSALSCLQQRLNSNTMFVENGEKIGIENVNLRIQLEYGKEYGLEIKSIYEDNTIVVVKIPKII